MLTNFSGFDIFQSQIFCEGTPEPNWNFMVVFSTNKTEHYEELLEVHDSAKNSNK
jgi:hypothetical protein